MTYSTPAASSRSRAALPDHRMAPSSLVLSHSPAPIPFVLHSPGDGRIQQPCCIHCQRDRQGPGLPPASTRSSNLAFCSPCARRNTARALRMTFGVIVSRSCAFGPDTGTTRRHLPPTPNRRETATLRDHPPHRQQQHPVVRAEYFLIVPRPALLSPSTAIGKRQPGGMPRPKRSRITMPELLSWSAGTNARPPGNSRRCRSSERQGIPPTRHRGHGRCVRQSASRRGAACAQGSVFRPE